MFLYRHTVCFKCGKRARHIYAHMGMREESGSSTMSSTVIYKRRKIFSATIQVTNRKMDRQWHTILGAEVFRICLYPGRSGLYLLLEAHLLREFYCYFVCCVLFYLDLGKILICMIIAIISVYNLVKPN